MLIIRSLVSLIIIIILVVILLVIRSNNSNSNNKEKGEGEEEILKDIIGKIDCLYIVNDNSLTINIIVN